MRSSRLWCSVFLAGLWSISGCKPPKYVEYDSAHGDFSCEIPWGWAVVAESAGTDYANVTFTGPLEPAFFRGVPSLSVRWYHENVPHRLPDGSYEIYASADDFVRQMMRDVYGQGSAMWAGADVELAEAIDRGRVFPKSVAIKVSNHAATFFVVYQTAKVPRNRVYGVMRDEAGERAVLERHAYAIVPLQFGFYVLTYPATRDGFEKYRPAFFNMVNTFRIKKNGPAGPANS